MTPPFRIRVEQIVDWLLVRIEMEGISPWTEASRRRMVESTAQYRQTRAAASTMRSAKGRRLAHDSREAGCESNHRDYLQRRGMRVSVCGVLCKRTHSHSECQAVRSRMLNEEARFRGKRNHPISSQNSAQYFLIANIARPTAMTDIHLIPHLRWLPDSRRLSNLPRRKDSKLQS